MKRRGSLVALLVAVGIGLLIRAWLMRLTSEIPDTVGVQINLPAEFDRYLSRIAILRECHEKKHAPQPGDWMGKFPEGGQTFAQYVRTCEQRPLHQQCSGIDIQPLGDFDETQQKLVAQSAKLMERFFGVPVRTLHPIALDDIPPDARRMRDDVEQILSTWIMNERLLPNRRPDAIATIGVVTCDLWPGGLNWVFGQAIIPSRIGVWSLHRYGNPRESEAAYRLCLLRSVKTAIHEVGHILGMPHCGEFECGMNGTRSLDEHDRRLLEFCPECQAKIWWTCGVDPAQRCGMLAEYCAATKWDRETKLFRREETLLKAAAGAVSK